ncbi:MAG TPA: hypothetical protein VIL78_05270, partial [Hanamia sp.]
RLHNVCGRPTTIFYTVLKRTINYIPFVTHCLDAKETRNKSNKQKIKDNPRLSGPTPPKRPADLQEF